MTVLYLDDTVSHSEMRHGVETGPSRSFLLVIDQEPDAVRRALIVGS